MAFVLHSQGVGQPIVVEDLLAKYGKPVTGRWAQAPFVPDRCDYCPLADIKPATGFVVRDDWRHGFCAEHKEEAEKEAE